MFQLINPSWLFALAALSIPVIIHLWNIRQGKTLKVGSIALMSVASRKSSRSFNLLDIPLLIARCLFLLLLAFLLASPFWVEQVKPGKIKGWILIPKENLDEAYRQFKPKIDSLSTAGYELHYFNPEFEKAAAEALTQLQTNAVKDSSGGQAAQYWPLLNELNNKIPPSLFAYLFTPDGISHFTGNRPDITLNLHWQTYLPADSAASWIQSAGLTPLADHIRITEGSSRPSGTVFTYSTIQGAEQRDSPYQINFNNGQPSVTYKTVKAGMINPNIQVDTATMRVAVYSDKTTSDAGYLLAALKAVESFTYRKISIKTYNAAKAIPGHQNWIFWLSEQQAPAAVIIKTQNLLTYEPGKAQSIQSAIDFQSQLKTALYKRVAFKPSSSLQPLWQDGFGSPVLALDNHGAGNVYHYYSHFDPSWNDLVWSDNFPKVMLNLILDQSVGSSPKSVKPAESVVKSAESKSKSAKSMIIDYRVIDQQQLLPNVTEPDIHGTSNKLNDITDLTKAFWLALALVFMIERWLAHKTKTAEIYG